MIEDTDNEHMLIMSVWQDGADALLAQYKDLASNLEKGDNMEIHVMTKQELFKKFKVSNDLQDTTKEINLLCQNIGKLVKDKKVTLCIDECWVTSPVQFTAHLTPVSFIIGIAYTLIVKTTTQPTTQNNLM